MLKIRRTRDRLIFKMELPIPGKDRFYIERGPSTLTIDVEHSSHSELPKDIMDLTPINKL